MIWYRRCGPSLDLRLELVQLVGAELCHLNSMFPSFSTCVPDTTRRDSAQEWVLRNFIHVRIEIATRDHSLPSSMLLQNPSRSSRTGPKEALNEASNMKAKRQA